MSEESKLIGHPAELSLKYKQKLDKATRNQLLTDFRDIKVGRAEAFFPTNSISTTKYTLYNFVFVNLYEQFSKVANLYFLFLAMLQMVKIVSITNGIPTILPPLAFIVFLTMIKDVFEDYKRYKSDLEENNKDTVVYRNQSPVEAKWQDLRVGDIIRVNKDQSLPADLVLLASSDFRKGIAFVETKNLDGETNLKSKFIAEDLKEVVFRADDVFKISGDFLNAEGPNLFLYSFKGSLTHKGTKIPLNSNNFLLRGCILRNTEYVIGVVTHTGHQTRVMLNSIRARPKKSTLEVDTGKSVLVTFAILISICLSAGIIYGIWDDMNTKTLIQYLYPESKTFFHNFITRMGNWILIFGNFVPISLMLTLETVKFFQGSLMSIDKGLIASNGIECKVQSSSLNEELGQIDYVFSDKTGTLTCNEMRFKYLIVGDQVYGKTRGYGGPVPDVKNVDFEDPAVWKSSSSGFATDDCKRLQEAIMLLGLCHSVVLESVGDYNASSPDELAFVYFAKLVGCEYKGMDDDNYMLMSEFGTIQKYRMLETIEFNSDRKRMSCFVQAPDGQIVLFTKGADSIMIPRYHQDRKHQFDRLMEQVEQFASIGLRTLLLGKREISNHEYQLFKTEYDKAKNDLNNRDKAMEEVEDRWERELTLVGATAIEDRLQDQVPETIEFMRMAGIKVWVLTGDKVDTAKNIGYSCKLLTHKGMKLLEYPKEFQDPLAETKKLKQSQTEFKRAGEKTGFVVAGDLLFKIMADETSELFTSFCEIALQSDAVLCCRVSPKQKQELVAMVKKAKPEAVTLSIGDGANDVNMITEAHVGIGIKGVEGQQAARASDYAIGEFKLLKRLLFFHGRESYRKNSTLILYNFFKNILLCVPQYWFGITNYLSGQTLYESFNYQMYNIVYTSLPIVLYALFDKHTTDLILLTDPTYYVPGPKRMLFNTTRFLKWFLWASIQALCLVYFSFGMFDSKFSTAEGNSYGFWVVGHMTFVGVVFLSNLKIATFSAAYSIATVVGMIGSFIACLLAWVFVSSFDYGVLEHTIWITIKKPQIYIFLFVLVGFTLIDWAGHKIIGSFMLTPR